MLAPIHTLDWHFVNPFAFEDRAAKAGEHANCGVASEDDRDLHAPALECDFEPVSVPFDKGREVNEELRHSIHASPSVSCGSPTQYRSVVTESVAIAAGLCGFRRKALSCKHFSNNRIRPRSSLRVAKRARVSPPLPRARTFSRTPAPMQPRQPRHCKVAVGGMKGALRVVLGQACRSLVSCNGNSAQTLSHVATPRGLVRTLHFIRPLVARREHGRAGAQSSMTIGKAIRP